MAVPLSGELKLWNTLWNSELGGTKGENSLHSASVYAGFSTPDALSDFYGWSDVEAPTVTTENVSNVQVNSQRINGNVTSTGNEAVNRGFWHGTSTNRTSNTKYTLGGTQNSTGGFNCTRTGLSQGTTYYNWAFACNSVGEAVGGRKNANTGYPPYTPNYQQAGRICGQTSVNHYPTSTQQFQNPSHSGKGCVGWYNPYSGGANNLKNCTISGTFYTAYDANNTFQWASGICNFHCFHATATMYYNGGPFGSFPPQFLTSGTSCANNQTGINRTSYQGSTNCSFVTPNHFTHDPISLHCGGTDSRFQFGGVTAHDTSAQNTGATGNGFVKWNFNTSSDIRLKTNINYL